MPQTENEQQSGLLRRAFSRTKDQEKDGRFLTRGHFVNYELSRAWLEKLAKVEQETVLTIQSFDEGYQPDQEALKDLEVTEGFAVTDEAIDAAIEFVLKVGSSQSSIIVDNPSTSRRRIRSTTVYPAIKMGENLEPALNSAEVIAERKKVLHELVRDHLNKGNIHSGFRSQKSRQQFVNILAPGQEVINSGEMGFEDIKMFNYPTRKLISMMAQLADKFAHAYSVDSIVSSDRSNYDVRFIEMESGERMYLDRATEKLLSHLLTTLY